MIVWMRHSPLPLRRAFPFTISTTALVAALAVVLVAATPGLARKTRAAQAVSTAAQAESAADLLVRSGREPRKILLVGDSFAQGLGLTMPQSLGQKSQAALANRGKVSSGLNSPQFYDWEKALTTYLDAEKPDVLLVMLGGNDAKNGRGTPQWAQDFSAKAKRFLDIAAGHGVTVYWVGLPPMREKAYSQRAWTANEAMRAACGAAGSCRFIDSWDLFADASGRFCPKKTLAGKAVSLRGKDGVHFTTAGCRLLTDRIVLAMADPR